MTESSTTQSETTLQRDPSDVVSPIEPPPEGPAAGPRVEITPLYTGIYEQVAFEDPDTEGNFGWRMEKKPESGAARVSIHYSPYPPPPFGVFGKALCGYQVTYRAARSGFHHFSIDVHSADVVQISGTAEAVAWIQGVDGTFRTLPLEPWIKGTLQIRDVVLEKLHGYTLVFGTLVTAYTVGFGASSFASFNGAFPRIVVEQPYLAQEDKARPLWAGLAHGIGRHATLDARCAALADDPSCALARSEELDLERVLSTGRASFITSNRAANAS